MHVVVLSRNYPNAAVPHLGLWVRRLCHALARHIEVTVISPTPYCPPGPWPQDLRKFRGVAALERDGPVEVHRPRFLAGRGSTTLAFEALAQRPGVAGAFARIARRSPVDAIHAHFAYADGAVAAWLARRYRVPLVITEHNLWQPWIDALPAVRRQALAAVAAADALIAVSQAVRLTMESVARRPVPARIVPIGVDGRMFRPAEQRASTGERLLYVGWLNEVKGVAVLLRALARLAPRRPHIQLTLIGGSVYRSARAGEARLRALATELALGDRVCFAGPQPEAAVAQAMREADALVLPSRRESCGSVLIEALASGTPVVATRSGGPEEIVDAAFGRLVPVDDPDALADAIDELLTQRERYPAAQLRERVLQRFEWERVAAEHLDIYREVLGRQRAPAAAPARA